MSYQVLARKWRPRTFQDMVGQEHILRMLKNALEQKRLHHAYLLTGTRGVGKTTLGRILAKCLNCETGITATPCGTCHICQAIDAGQFLDLHEVDAASRTKVEDTRELLENVMYPPSIGRFKVYLIDEVHMLSNHSFNALLKTLEEPPEHVKFFLATTDPKRLPITIISRCLQFHLKRISEEQIANHLNHICSQENITNDNTALERLAKAADGSMRDALSLLDQAIAYGHGEVNKADVVNMLGCLSQDDLFPLLEALSEANGAALFEIIRALSERGPDFSQLLEELIQLLHQIAMTQIVPSLQKDEQIKQLSQRFRPEDIQLHYQIALLGRRDLAYTPNPKQGFEMTMLRMLALKPAFNQTHQTLAPIEPIQAPTKKEPLSEPTPVAKMAASTGTTEEWRDILPKLELTGMAYALASNCTLHELTDTQATLHLSKNHQPMLNDKLKERLEEALTRYLGRTMQLNVKATSDNLLTPAKQQAEEQSEELGKAKQTMLEDPKIKQLLDMYDATLEVSLLT